MYGKRTLPDYFMHKGLNRSMYNGFALFNNGAGTTEELAKIFKEKSEAAITEALKKFKEEDAEYKTLLALRDEVKSLKNVEDSEVFKILKKNLEDLGIDVKALKEKPAATKAFTVKGQIIEQLTAAKESLRTLREKKGTDVTIVIKSAGTLLESNVTPTTPGGLSMLLTDFEPGITRIPRSQPFMVDLVSSAPTNNSVVSYAEMKNPDGGASTTAEGGAKSQADFDIVEAKTNVRKITAFIKTSKEALADIPALAAEINNELLTLIALKEDSQILDGDGTGNNLTGILEVAPAFTGGALALTVTSPNNFDVMAASVAQIMTAEVISGQPAGFMPTAIVVNTIDFMSMKLTKDKNDNYLFPVFLPGVNQVIQVPIVINPRMTQGEFLVGDFTKANRRLREDVNINIGYDGNDFTNNLVTILAEMRVAFYVKSNHVKAFVTGSFSDAIAALTKTPSL